MAKATTEQQAMLVKLSDSDWKIADRAEDIRGRTVIDRDGEEIGEVEDLFLDEREQKVRFLEVSSGGFLGMGETNFLIPVDAITGIGEDEVRIDKNREQVSGAPRYSPDLVEKNYWNNLYSHYGYTPFWGVGYVYPSYPYYPMYP